MCIDKNEHALAIIKNKEEFYWFCAFKEMWVLDRVKWFKDFVENGIDVFDENDHRERYNIDIVNTVNCKDFIDLLKKDGCEINKELISREFYKMDLRNITWWDAYVFFPDLFIDFDSLKLYSQYVENMHYEKYVPAGWKGEVQDFCKKNIIPKSECFWIKDGIDYRNILLSKV